MENVYVHFGLSGQGLTFVSKILSKIPNCQFFICENFENKLSLEDDLYLINNIIKSKRPVLITDCGRKHLLFVDSILDRKSDRLVKIFNEANNLYISGDISLFPDMLALIESRAFNKLNQPVYFNLFTTSFHYSNKSTNLDRRLLFALNFKLIMLDAIDFCICSNLTVSDSYDHLYVVSMSYRDLLLYDDWKRSKNLKQISYSQIDENISIDHFDKSKHKFAKDVCNIYFKVILFLAVTAEDFNLMTFLQNDETSSYSEMLIAELVDLYKIGSIEVLSVLHSLVNKLKENNLNACAFAPWINGTQTKKEFYNELCFDLKKTHHKNYKSPQLFIVRWVLDTLKMDLTRT